MPFTHHRTVRFQDTDAAGVVYFANVLAMCHEAYEASLAASGIHLQLFFRNPDLAIPITHARVDFRHPMFCGDALLIHLTPQKRSEHQFEIAYQLVADSPSGQTLARAITRHVCIEPSARTKVHLPASILQWLSCWSGD